MVLEDVGSAGDASASSFSEAAPTSDSDPYANGTADSHYLRVPSGSDEPLYVNLDALPRMRSMFGRPVRAQTTNSVNNIIQSCQFAANILNRPLKQEEVDALAFHTATTFSVASAGVPLGFIVATLQASRGFANYRFPFWTPDMSPGGKYSPDRWGPLSGPRARIMWQLSRVSAYLLCGALVGPLFTVPYAMSRNAVGRATDPRLKEFMEALAQKAKDGRMETAMQAAKRGQDVSDGPARGETFEMARQRRAAQQQQENMRRARQAPRRRPVDDMSPTAGTADEDFMGMGNDDAASTYQSNQPFSEQRQSRQPVPDYSTSSSTQATPRQAGSTWDRLRQDAMSGNQTSSGTSSQPPPRSSSGPRGGDSFAFSQPDEDRQLARGEAQKEFDARIEREREGKDFEDGSRRGKGGRW